MTDRRFDGFVLFAEMRTGSNYLEASLNNLSDVTCYGEVFNPTFIGSQNRFELFGYDMDAREADPIGLLDAMMARTDGIAGLRLFHDHNDQVLGHVLPNPRIGKVILSRNPLDSYISRKIASATGQWKLTDVKDRRGAKITFDAEEFAQMVERLQAFQLRVQHALQISGQTAFYIRYEDINDAEILNGLATYLGSKDQVEAASDALKKQNPGDLEDKVENYAEMIDALRQFDRFDLAQTPNFEPPRRTGVPGFVAHPDVGLLFMPIKGAAEEDVLDWMGEIGGVGRQALLRRMSQKDLRQWMKAHPGFRSFSVLRHPVARAYEVFNRFIVPNDRPAYAEARQVLRQRYKVPIPPKGIPDGYTPGDHQAAFLAFLQVLKGNLAGQTSLRIDQAWASQTAILQGMGQVTPPHHLLRDDDLTADLNALATSVGVASPPPLSRTVTDTPFPLKAVYNGKIEQAAIDAYRRDYQNFGFPRWNRQ